MWSDLIKKNYQANIIFGGKIFEQQNINIKERPGILKENPGVKLIS